MKPIYITHFAGYGKVEAKKIEDKTCTLHIKVTGNHEWGIVREDDYDLFRWLVKRFDKTMSDYAGFYSRHPRIEVIPGYDLNHKVETCDYKFNY